MWKIATSIHKIRRTEKDDCSSSRIISPHTKISSYSFIKEIPRIFMVSEVQEAVNGSNFEPAGTDPPFDTTLTIHFLIMHISTIRFHKWYMMCWYDMILFIYLPLDFISDIWYMMWWYDMIYLTAIVLTPGGSSTAHIYTQTIHRTTLSTQTIKRITQFTN
jgi:hypothetical protein